MKRLGQFKYSNYQALKKSLISYPGKKTGVEARDKQSLTHYTGIKTSGESEAQTDIRDKLAMLRTFTKGRFKISIHRKLLLFIFLMLAGNVFIGYTVYKNNQKLLDSGQLAQLSQQVIYQADYMLSLGKDIETASRGFVITNDSAFLEPLFEARKTIPSDMAKLRQLVRNNPAQLKRMDSLNFYLHRRLDFSLAMIRVRSEQGLSPAITFTATREGKDYFDNMRRITSTIKQEESVLLNQRNQLNAHSVSVFKKFTIVTFIVIGLFSVLFVIAAGNYLRQNFEKEKQAEALRVAYKELVFQNKEKEKRENELIMANRELQKAEDKIRKLNEQSERKVMERTEQLRSANKELEAFSYSVSHDLRAPLRAVHGYTQMLKEDFGAQLNQEANRVMTNIMSNAKKMGQLIDDLLTFSHIGRKEMAKMNIPMTEMVTSICSEIDNPPGHPVEFKIQEMPPAQGDTAAIKQVWVNLISNAVKYSKLKENPVIEIGSETNDNITSYYVQDNGVGFDMRYANKLFGVFQRLHSDEKFEGTGVGLAIVHRIIVKHGGKVWAQGKINEGATFYFSLP